MQQSANTDGFFLIFTQKGTKKAIEKSPTANF